MLSLPLAQGVVPVGIVPILGHVGHHLAPPQLGQELRVLITFIGAQSDGRRAGVNLLGATSVLIQQAQCGFALGRRRGLGGAGRHHQSMAILDQHMPQVAGPDRTASLFLYRWAWGSVFDSCVSRSSFSPRRPVPCVGGGSLG